MTTLSYVFFVIAGVWLIAALLYSLLVLCFLRLRANGELGNMDDEDFGRIPIGVSGRFYLPLGCIFRRYARHLQLDDDLGIQVRSGNAHFMTKSERRNALELLLQPARSEEQGALALPKRILSILRNNNRRIPVNETSSTESSSIPEDDESSRAGHDVESLCSENVPMCSICLCEYEADDAVFVPTTCSHQFHHDCILDWLQLPGRTECPCCRVSMVEEDAVWKEVKRLRQERKNAMKKERKMGGHDDNGEASETEEMDDSASSFDEAATSI